METGENQAKIIVMCWDAQGAVSDGDTYHTMAMSISRALSANDRPLRIILAGKAEEAIRKAQQERATSLVFLNNAMYEHACRVVRQLNGKSVLRVVLFSGNTQALLAEEQVEGVNIFEKQVLNKGLAAVYAAILGE